MKGDSGEPAYSKFYTFYRYIKPIFLYTCKYGRKCIIEGDSDDITGI